MAKFDDIKPITPNGNYEIDVFFRYLPQTLKDLDDDYELEMNPEFQRGNVWTEEQQVRYMEFFLRGGRTARVIYFNTPGFSNGKQPHSDLDDKIVCVDGLQRLTALLRFHNNELKVFGHYYREFEDKCAETIRFNINDLQTKAEVLQWYIDFNSGGTVHSEDEINRVKQMLAEVIN